MKKYFFIFLIPILSMLVACGPTKEEAKVYNDFIIEHQDSVLTKISDLIISYQTNSSEEINSAHNAAFIQVNKSIDEISKMEDFDGTSNYKKAALEMFNSYKSLIDVEHREMTRLYSKSDTSFTPEDSQKLDELAEIANTKMDEIVDTFMKIQKEFADKNNLELN